MNNLPLQPLVWTTESDTPSAKSPLHYYDIIREYSCGESCFVRYQKVEAGRNIKQATGFSSFDEAKEWCWNHYNEKMQPYVKPMPTWIDASERLPESECFYLVRLFDGHRDEHVFVILWWNSEHQQFLEWDAMCEPTHWMPIPEFKQGE